MTKLIALVRVTCVLIMRYIIGLFIVPCIALLGCQQTNCFSIDLRILIVQDKGFPAVPEGQLTDSIQKANSLLTLSKTRLRIRTIKRERLSTFMSRVGANSLEEIGGLKSVIAAEKSNSSHVSAVTLLKRTVQEATKNANFSELPKYWYIASSNAWKSIFPRLGKYNMVVVNFPVFKIDVDARAENLPDSYIVNGLGNVEHEKVLISYALWNKEKKFTPSYSEQSDYYIASIIIHEILHAYFQMSHKPLRKKDIMNPGYESKIYFQTKPVISEKTVQEIRSMQEFKQAKNCFDQKESAEAERYLRQSLDIMPENVSALELKSQILLSEGKIEEKRKLDRSIAALKARNEFWDELARKVTNNYSLGSEARYRGDVKKAVEYYKAALSEGLETLTKKEILADVAHRTLVELADIYSLQTDYNEAVTTAEMLLEYWPNDLQAIYILGKSYYYMRDFDKASKYLLKYLEIDPEGIRAGTARIFIRNISKSKGDGTGP